MVSETPIYRRFANWQVGINTVRETDSAGDLFNGLGGEVYGSKWEDLNVNGQRDDGVPGFAGVVIYADLNGNGVLEVVEPQTETMRDEVRERVGIACRLSFTLQRRFRLPRRRH